jgi:hypothetical protein
MLADQNGWSLFASDNNTTSTSTIRSLDNNVLRHLELRPMAHIHGRCGKTNLPHSISYNKAQGNTTEREKDK